MITLEVRGFLVGPIWWPVGVLCWKDLSYNITLENKRLSEPGTLRHHLLAITGDGDFADCSVARGELIAKRTTHQEGRTVTVERRWPLNCFKSILDCLHDDPDWYPSFPEDEEEN